MGELKKEITINFERKQEVKKQGECFPILVPMAMNFCVSCANLFFVELRSVCRLSPKNTVAWP